MNLRKNKDFYRHEFVGTASLYVNGKLILTERFRDGDGLKEQLDDWHEQFETSRLPVEISVIFDEKITE